MPAQVVAGQVASGGVSSTSVVVSGLPSATTAGNTVFVVFGTYGRTMATTAGFVIDSPSSVANARVQVFRRSNVPAGETSWTFTTGVALAEAWIVFEVEGLDASTPLDVVVSAVSAASSGTAITSNTTPTSTAYDAFVLAAWVGSIVGATPGTLSGITNGFAEIAQQGAAGTADSAVLSVASLPAQALSTFTSTATHSATLTTTVPGAGVALVYAAAGSRRAANVQIMAGAEQGTAAGLTTGVAGAAPFDFQAGTVTVVTTTPRSGSYCYRVTGSAAVGNFGWNNPNSLGSSTPIGVKRVCFLFEGTLPTSDVEIYSMGAVANAASQLLVLRYRSASQKVGLQVRETVTPANGTEQLSATTVAADTWYALDDLFDGSQTSATSGSYLGSWALDGVAQTQATVTAPATTGGVAAVTFGPLTAPTGSYTIRYDDIVFSRTAGHYPLGDFRILPLKPDPAGTLTISGTAANFNTFTANGTMAAWNAATALAAIDDLPPTIGASADGIAQVTLAATDYVEIPMETYDAATNNAALRAVRMYAAGWGAGSPAAATLGFRGFEGTTETVLLSVQDPSFTNSTTTPGWVAKMFKPTGGWTQAKLDALTFRVGFSGDATPDIGIHSIMAEVAVRVDPTTVRVAEVTGLEGVTSTAFVDARLDADSAAVIGYDATPAPDFDANVTYTERGSDTNTPLPAGAAVATEIVGADTVDDVTNLSIGPA